MKRFHLAQKHGHISCQPSKKQPKKQCSKQLPGLAVRKASKRIGEEVSDGAGGLVFCLLAVPVVMVTGPLGCLNVHEELAARQGKRLAPVAVIIPRWGSGRSKHRCNSLARMRCELLMSSWRQWGVFEQGLQTFCVRSDPLGGRLLAWDSSSLSAQKSWASPSRTAFSLQALRLCTSSPWEG